MPLVKLHHIISFTSEDQKHKAENLINGNGIWLCSPNNQTGSINIEFQIEKATAIDYVDIGNHNCAMISIEVGMSSWPSSQKFVSLLPTVVLMTPPDCRSGKNAEAVRMFKKDNLVKENVGKKWDRLRVICSQPFMKGTQFGLAFLKIYAQENYGDTDITIDNTEEIRNKENLMSFFKSKSAPQEKISESLQILEKSRLTSLDSDSPAHPSSGRPITSPLSRAGKLVMARRQMPNEADAKKQKKELELESLNFLVSLNLTKEDIHSLRVSHIRTEFEVRRSKPLDVREKLIFKSIALDYCAERLRKLDVIEETKHPDEVNKTPGKSSVFKFKRSGNSSQIEDASASHGLSRNDLALVDSVVTNSASIKRKNAHEVSWKNSVRHLKNKKMDNYDSDESDDLKCIFSTDLFSESGVGRPLGGSSLDKFGTSREKSMENFVECPLCEDLFSGEVIEDHASSCEGKRASGSSLHAKMDECPICGNMFEAIELQNHAEECAERSFA